MNDFTEFRPMTGMDTNSIQANGYGMVQYGPSDDKLLAGFYKKSVLNAARSRQEGRPIYEGRDFVKIQHPGETLNVVDRPATDSDKQRFPRQWMQYERGVTQIPDGVPLNQLFPDKPQIVDMMRGYNIHTVEQLSNLSAQAIGTVGMGCQEWVNAAKRYMERAEKGVDHHKFETTVNELKSHIARLERQNAELAGLVRQQNSDRRVPDPATAGIAQSSFDPQADQIAAMHPSTTEPFVAPPAQFHTDLSQQVQPERRRPGRPRKVQEN